MAGLEVVQGGGGAPGDEAVFFYDLASPDAYLIAERIRAELPLVCDWEPVHGVAIDVPVDDRPDVEAITARAEAQQLLPFRVPAVWPPDSGFAMRAATYAKGGGKSIAFSLAAFRQAFAGARDLGDEATVLLAAAACEMHPTAVLKGAATRSTAAALARAGRRALAAGVTALPAFTIAGVTTCGPRALDDALATLTDR